MIEVPNNVEAPWWFWFYSPAAVMLYLVLGLAAILLLGMLQIRANKRAAAVEMVCSNPNCGHRGAMTYRPRGSPGVLIFLFICGVLPGLIYMLFAGGHDVVCPRCKLAIGRA